MEQFFGDRVNVSVSESIHSGDIYCRSSLLSLAGTGRVVQLGVVKIDLTVLSPAVREAILAERTPLGRPISVLDRPIETRLRLRRDERRQGGGGAPLGSPFQGSDPVPGRPDVDLDRESLDHLRYQT